MNKLPDIPCRKCGNETIVRWVASSGMDIKPTGMFRICPRCGFEESIDSLDEEDNKLLAEKQIEPNQPN